MGQYTTVSPAGGREGRAFRARLLSQHLEALLKNISGSAFWEICLYISAFFSAGALLNMSVSPHLTDACCSSAQKGV